MNYSRIVPPDTYIGRYMQAGSVLETSASYDFWCAVWTLGSCLGRGVYVPRPHAPVFMNWYIMLVAESGVTRKSTAVRMARDIVSAYLSTDHLVEGRATPEYLFELLTKEPHLAIAVSELVTFLGRESYIIELPAMLTDLYDCPPIKRGGSVTKGERVIRDAFVTFLSASTPSWLRSSVNPTVVEGGFTSRCLFVHDERPKSRIAWPSDEHQDIQQLASVLHDTVSAAQAVGSIDLMPSGRRRFETWYKKRDTSSIVPFIASFNSREDAHVLRLAAALAVNDGTLAMERKHIDAAIKCVMQVKAGAVMVFQDTGNTVKVAQGIEKMIRMLIEAGPLGIPHTRLYAAVRYYMNRDEFHIITQSMHEMEMIAQLIEARSGGGRRGIRYVRTPQMTNTSKMTELMQTVT